MSHGVSAHRRGPRGPVERRRRAVSPVSLRGGSSKIVDDVPEPWLGPARTPEGGAPPPKRPRRDPHPNPGALALADPGVVAHAEEKTSAHAQRDEKPSADAPVAEAEEAGGVEPGTARYVMLTLRRLAAGGDLDLSNPDPNPNPNS